MSEVQAELGLALCLLSPPPGQAGGAGLGPSLNQPGSARDSTQSSRQRLQRLHFHLGSPLSLISLMRSDRLVILGNCNC